VHTDLKAVEVGQEVFLPQLVEQSQLLVATVFIHLITLVQIKHLLLAVLATLRY
jgi:hypothetical protein